MEQRSKFQNQVKVGEAMIIIVPIVIWLITATLSGYTMLIHHDDSISTLKINFDKHTKEQKDHEEKNDARWDEIQKSLNDIKLSLKDKQDRK